MKEVYIYIISLLGGCWLGLAGCTACLVEEVPEDAKPVELVFGNPDLGEPELLTRAGTEVTPLPVGATVRIVAYYRGAMNTSPNPVDFLMATPYAEATYVVGASGTLSPCRVDETGGLVAGQTNGLSVRSGVYDFYAVSPARPLTKEANNNQWMIQSLPHKEDVMTSFVRGITVTPKGNERVQLNTFIRRCALVVFNVATVQQTGLPPIQSLKGTSLQITKVSRTGAVLKIGEQEAIAKTGNVAGGEGTISFATNEFEPVVAGLDPGNLGLNKVTGEILPKDAQAFDVAVTVMRDGITAHLKATIDQQITFDEGKRYVFTLQVKNDISRLMLRVIAWTEYQSVNDMGGEDVRSAGGLKSGLLDPDICEGVGTPVVVAEWKHVDWKISEK